MVFGKGINDFSEPVSSKGVKIREYVLWKSMLERCYSKHNIVKNKSYYSVIVEDELLSFSNFYSFVRTLKGFDKGNWQLDKDILGSGYIYSKENIAFVPREVNIFFAVDRNKHREKPIGVKLDRKCGKLFSSMKKGGKTVFLGYFEYEIGAHKAYLKSKSEYGKELALKYKDFLDARVLRELNNYESWFKRYGCH